MQVRVIKWRCQPDPSWTTVTPWSRNNSHLMWFLLKSPWYLLIMCLFMLHLGKMCIPVAARPCLNYGKVPLPKEACTVRGPHVGDKMMGMYSSARKFGLVTLWEVRDMHEQPWHCSSSYILSCYPIAPLTHLQPIPGGRLAQQIGVLHILQPQICRTNYCSQRICLKISVANFYRV